MNTEESFKLILGDCLEQLKPMRDNTVDAVICDPPYGLKFMGKEWDYDVPKSELWRMVIRVLKPGGHLLSFGGTRTYHRMVVEIEDAGFEVRDQIQWIYGSGFPKSLDVSKAIDKAAGVEREVVNTFDRRSRQDGAIRNSKGNTGDSQCSGRESTINITAPATPDAIKWQGFGTALKPANEPIVLARKPLSEKTVAKNILRWGTGALNIDGSRINYQTDERVQTFWNNRGGATINANESVGTKPQTGEGAYDPTKGRWPANVLFDEEAAAMLDEQSGVSSARGGAPKEKSDQPGQIAFSAVGGEKVVRNDSGGASRFFYCAKSSKSERNAGLEGMPKVGGPAQMQEGSIGKIRSDGTVIKEAIKHENFHPTVKPIKLMEYLCKLITPPGGVILDPFMGSGSTGVAAAKLGFRFIGIEMNEEYLAIAQKRIEHVGKEPA